MNRMLKLIFMAIFVVAIGRVTAQEVEIKKSADVIVLQGKSFYLHTVLPGQTLFAICKAYEVNIEAVKELNKKGDDALRLYEVLRIPYVEPFVQQDEKYYYHKVQKGETIYSVARLYSIKPKRLLKFNEAYTDQPLSIGSVLKLPLKEIVFPEKGSESVDTLSSNPILYQQEYIAVDTQVVLHKDTLPIPVREELFKETFQPHEIFTDSDSAVRVVLLLPLSAKAYPEYQDSITEVTLSARSEMFVGFYEGILLAVDSLKRVGKHIDLYVYDTERSVEKAYRLVEELNQVEPHLIIGPVYASVYKVFAEQLVNKNIPLIYPLSTRGEQFGVSSNFVQVNASLELIAENMLQWLDEKRLETNILYLDVKGTKNPEALTNIQFKERLLAKEGVRSFAWNLEKVPLDSLRVLLLPDRENIIVLPEENEGEISKVLPLLSALTDSYQLTVLGLPEWQTFTSIDHETFYKLNTKLFSYSYVDYSLESVKSVVEKYRKYFYTEPNSLFFKAYDMGLYFMSLSLNYRERFLEALVYEPRIVGCSKFQFKMNPEQAGKENNGLYIVNYSSDYQLKITEYNP